MLREDLVWIHFDQELVSVAGSRDFAIEPPRSTKCGEIRVSWLATWLSAFQESLFMKLEQWSKLDLRSYAAQIRNYTDVSWQPIGPIFKGQAVQLGPLRWDRQAVPKRRYIITNLRWVRSQKIVYLIYTATAAWDHAVVYTVTVTSF